jgi:hypothetical protein
MEKHVTGYPNFESFLNDASNLEAKMERLKLSSASFYKTIGSAGRAQ